MDALKSQFEELTRIWKEVYEASASSPNLWAAHLPGTSLEQVDEVVRCLNPWLGTVKPPHGFTPAFHLAQGVVTGSIAQALTSVKSLKAGEYNYLPVFLAQITQICSAVHSMVVFSSKAEVRKEVADLAGKFSESLSLLGTAQREIKGKAEALDKVNETVQAGAKDAEAILQLKISATATIQEIETMAEDASAEAEEITTHNKAFKEISDQVKELAKEAASVQEKNLAQQEIILKLENACLTQQAKIDTLLTGAANAGLASAFASRVGKLNVIKYMWMGFFLFSVIALFYVAWSYKPASDLTPAQVWLAFLYRLPLIGPCIWLGWVSAMQYGNTVRVQEDYAFKEATSRAFEGYRSHMENLANIDLEEGNNAMKMLAATTIAILANEPLRVFSKTERDAAPLSMATELLKRLQSKVDKE